ncbi:recombinase family protein [Alicyclobacillus tolerans]|uniref:recombinase family protein n=1 Tax=Alicyclobacillus tolerans TaxID=90970 RepID=UPI001F2E6B26|nr:recombinase family protein [Alicyclobacillus tolerans]MCF8563909.1 recombinase family protein [Alicyclobacillus tolerans]
MSSFPENLQHVAIYLRKSRADVDAESRGEGETLSKHKKALLELSRRFNYTIDHIYEEIVSGERIVDRPQMQELLHRVHDGRYQAVLCMDIDRLGRGNMIDQGLIQDTFKTSRTLIVTLRKVYDLRDEMDEEWSEFEAFMARRELKIITRRMQRGRRQSAGAGRSISKKPPYGYLRSADLKLHPDPSTSPVVKLIFQMSAQGTGPSFIAQHLTSLGIATPTGKSVWTRSSVHAILNNPAYAGHIVWGTVRFEKSRENHRKYIRLREKPENWVVCRDAHEPLVDSDTYERCRDASRKRPKVPVKKELSNPLAGLLYCGECGKAMRRQQTYNRPLNSLLCPTTGCKTKGARFEIVEQRLLDALYCAMGNLKIDLEWQSFVEGFTANSEGEWTLLERQIQKLQADVSELCAQQEALYDLLERGVYDVDTFHARHRLIAAKIQSAKEKLIHTTVALQRSQAEAELAENLELHSIDVVSAYKLAPTAKVKNDLLRTAIEKVVYVRDPDWKLRDQFELEVFLRF